MSWKDDLKTMGQEALEALDLNRADYSDIVDVARTACPFHGESGQAWIEGFDEAYDRVKDGLAQYRDSMVVVDLTD